MLSNSQKKIKLEETISEFLVADMVTQNQVLKLAMLKMSLRNNNNNNNNKPKKKMNHRLQNVAEDYQPGDSLRKEHKYSSFYRSSKRCEKSEAPHINKDSSPLCVLIMFFTEIFLVLME
jgi:hypothetical protein